MVLEMIRVYDGCFDGDILYENPLYESPNELRRRMKVSLSDRYSKKKESMAVAENRRLKRGATHDVDQLEAVFEPQTTTGPVRDLELSMWNGKKKKKTTMGKRRGGGGEDASC